MANKYVFHRVTFSSWLIFVPLQVGNVLLQQYLCGFCCLFCFHRYKAVIDACSLQPDIDILPHGDQTQIGERVSKQLQASIFGLNI